MKKSSPNNSHNYWSCHNRNEKQNSKKSFKLNLTVKIIGKISIPIKTIKPGSKNTYLCLKFIQ